MVSELDTDKKRSVAKAGIVAEKIRITLAQPYMLTSRQEIETTIVHYCTSSIGVVLFLGQESTQKEILKCADMAMYQAEQGGRNTIRFFDECLEEKSLSAPPPPFPQQ